MPDESTPSPLRVSVPVPTDNRAGFLQRALDSLFAQTETDWELLIVDDGSTDGTAAPLQPYLAAPLVHPHRFERNRRLGDALNAGLDDARASLVRRVGADALSHDGRPAAVRPRRGLAARRLARRDPPESRPT